MNIAIIPARIGSKRIFQKNIKKFHGRPILLWTIEKIINSKIFDKIIVSSDSRKVFKIVKKKNVHFHTRHKKNSDDKATTISAINSCINSFKFNLNDNICCIYPCAVFLEKKVLLKTLKLLKNNKFVLPATKYQHPVERSFKLSNKSKLISNFPKHSSKNTQIFRPSFHDTGQFYWAKTKTWLKSKNIFLNSVAFIVPNGKTIDIDDKESWKKAVSLFKIKK